MEALLSPICQIAENAGYNSEDIVDMQNLQLKIKDLMPKW